MSSNAFVCRERSSLIVLLSLKRRIPSVEQTAHEPPKISKAPSPITDPSGASTANTHHQPSASAAAAPTALNSASNRRELPNVPRNTPNHDTKPSPSPANQNPFYNASASSAAAASTTAAAASGTPRSTPAQWMGNIGQTIRRQASNAVEVRPSINSIRPHLSLRRAEIPATKTNPKTPLPI